MKFPALSRSLKRAESSLPKNRAQKRGVVKALFEDTIPVTPRKSKLLSVWSNIYLPKPKVKGRKAFFHASWSKSPSICWEGCQRRLPVPNQEIFTVAWTYQELLGLIQTEDHEELSSITFSTLYHYVSPKKEYIGRRKIPQVNCLCPDCENVELICTGINKCCESMEIPTKCHDLALKIACDPITEKRVTKKCEHCPSLEWAILNEQIHYVKVHYYRKRIEDTTYREQINRFKDEELVIHVDYTENYKNKQQSEIKAGY